ncbi:MAG TPA: hypothetical protein VMF58_11345 [Rhizomicrobium sp.]|nr:hypothetical protein [Rhizomicrobium sp.]
MPTHLQPQLGAIFLLIAFGYAAASIYRPHGTDLPRVQQKELDKRRLLFGLGALLFLVQPIYVSIVLHVSPYPARPPWLLDLMFALISPVVGAVLMAWAWFLHAKYERSKM